MKSKNFRVRLSWVIICVICFGWMVAPVSAYSQTLPPMYCQMDYMKVKPLDVDKYLQMEKEIWKPIHKARISQKEIWAWHLYRVLNTGTGDAYNYVTVAFFDDPYKLEKIFQVDLAKIHPGKDVNKVMEETVKLRDLVKSDIISRVNEVMPDGGPGIFKYLRVDYMKVKQENEAAYLEVEGTIWKPVHKELVNAGQRAGWILYSCLFPGGFGREYQYATVNILSNYGQLFKADFGAAAAKAHPGKNVEEMLGKTFKSRDLVRTEIWELIDYAYPE